MPDFEIPEEALSERFLAATGPGGQNVNKVATACQLRVEVFRLGLAPHAYEKLKRLAGSRLTSNGELVITARRFRTQEANRAREKLRYDVARLAVVGAEKVLKKSVNADAHVDMLADLAAEL